MPIIGLISGQILLSLEIYKIYNGTLGKESLKYAEYFLTWYEQLSNIPLQQDYLSMNIKIQQQNLSIFSYCYIFFAS